jgi:hypothetical protein
VRDEKGQVVGYGSGLTNAENLTNARLFAASKEMLAALKRAAGALNGYDYPEICAAIAKAEGCAACEPAPVVLPAEPLPPIDRTPQPWWNSDLPRSVPRYDDGSTWPGPASAA